MSQPIEKFKSLLRELFQFDCADLDFGIYRIMNHKRDVIERFLERDLPDSVAEQLEYGALAAQSQAARELQDLAVRVKETLGPEALDADGNLTESGYSGTPLGKKYIEMKAQVEGANVREALEASIFSHLYAFFSRYYQGGDFISKRRYSKRERYVIPYNGEETYFYWANYDQYYVKTAEHFTDYTFTANGVTVCFKLQTANVEQNNVKGDRRFFVPSLAEISWDEAARQLVVPFQYRPLTKHEDITYAQHNRQESIIADTLEKIPKRLSPKAAALTALTATKRVSTDGRPVTYLEHHLRQYTRRNMSDFFIHKDLKGFLSRELDFYLKNEVLSVDEMGAAGEERIEGWFQMMRIIKNVGGRIVEFLDQIENFQKLLWEKRKFITETQYCIAIGYIPAEFYPTIAACEPQWGEWKVLYHIDEEQPDLFADSNTKKEKRITYLNSRPTLVVDTKHLDPLLVDRLLSSFAELDVLTDGLLIQSENWQALSFMRARYQGKIQTVTIDPPYNRLGDGFPYKDNYRHSSWATMIRDRLASVLPLLQQEGVLFSNIDENERDTLQAMLDSTFGRGNRIAELIWAQNTTHSQSPLYSMNHEYIEVYARGRAAAERAEAMFREPKPGFSELTALLNELNPRYLSIAEVEAEIQALFQRHTEKYNAELHEQGLEYDSETKKQDPWRGLYNYCHVEYRAPSGELVAEKYAKQKGARLMVWRESDPSAPAQKQAGSTRDPQDPNFRFYEPLHPKTGKPCVIPKRGWALPYEWPDAVRESFKELDRAGRIVWGDDETKIPQYKRFLHDVETNVAKSFFYDYTDGEKQLAALFGATGIFPTPKPTTLPARFISQTAGKNSSILDHFAGSGTTGHAIIDLNREDGGRRKFILVEPAHYFDTVLLPRIKKVSFAPEWKDGKPKRLVTAEETERSPRIIKYLRLESYEDALNNIVFDDPSQRALKFDDYLLQYMLQWETRGSETLLNIEKLAQPFGYRLNIYAGGQTQKKVVDLPETFNYLVGLSVQTRRVYDDNGRRYLIYRGQIDERNLAVIWRETEGWKKTDFERDREFVVEQRFTEGADEVFVNGDSLLPNARALDSVLKGRIFAPLGA